jgi:hypothetical protein
VQAARKHHLLIVHSPNGQQIHEIVKPLPGEIVVDGSSQQAQLRRLLQQKSIQYLLYAGYTSNISVLNHPCGVIAMSRHCYQNILVRDASLAFEAPEFLKEELTHKVVAYMVETNWGVTATVDQVLAALEERSSKD